MTRLYACLDSGNCYKPWLALHQIGRPASLQMVDLLAGEHKAPAYLAVNPAGVVPYMITPDGHGIGESNAMTWYLAEGTALMPATAEDRAEALQWMFFEQSKLEPFISPARFFTTIVPHLRPTRTADIARWQDQARVGLARLDAHLSQRRFILASGYCVADIAVFGYVHLSEEAGLSFRDMPHVARWTDAVRETDGFCPIGQMGIELKAAA